MDSHFNYAHTILIESEDESSQQLDNLFKIGGNAVPSSKKEKEENSDKRKQKKIRKKSKEKKEKKKKKKKKQIIDLIEDESEHSTPKKQKGKQPLGMEKLELQIKPSNNYQIEQKNTVQDILAQEFAFNQQIVEGGVKFDILMFPNENLYNYGPLDKDIPRYERLQRFLDVVGMKKGKKGKKLVKELNKKINQKADEDREQNKDRYFHFQGYDLMNSTKVLRLKQKSIEEEGYIKFECDGKEQYAESDEEKLNQMSKSYNRQLNQNPQNVELWVRFISMQDKIHLNVENQQKNSYLVERKIAIAQKALKFNEHSEKLALLYLKLLSQFKKDRSLIQKQTLELIKINPQSWQLWLFYLQYKISNFVFFSHTRLQNDYEQISTHLQATIQKTQSAMQIWKVRKASICILNQVLRVYQMEGYKELATAICVALLEYNILHPHSEEFQNNDLVRFKKFREYWEDYTKYHVGEKENCCWEKNLTFQINQQSSIFIQQYGFGNTDWLPSHTKHHQKRIQSSPESFILFDDLSPYLKVFRSGENIEMLLDLFANNLQMPVVFGTVDSSLFKHKWLENAFMQDFTSKIQLQFCFWNRYWNPKQTKQFLPQQNWLKFIYVLRVFKEIKRRYKNKKISEYLLFLYGVIYSHSPFHLYLSKENCLQEIKELLSEDLANPRLWAIYIEVESINGKSQTECLQCYYQCLQFTSELIDKLWVIYWLKSYLSRQKLKTSIILIILNDILLNNFSLSSQEINEMVFSNESEVSILEVDKILLSNKLKQCWSLVHNNDENKSIIYYFLLQLGYRSEEIVQHLFNTEFGLDMLMDQNLLSIHHFLSQDLFTKNQSTRLVKYWLNLLPSLKLLTLSSEFQKVFSERKLQYWLTIMRLLTHEYQHMRKEFHHYFIEKAKQIGVKCLASETEYVITINKMIKDESYAFYCFQNLPYCGELYELLWELEPDKREKIESLTLEREIRKRVRV